MLVKPVLMHAQQVTVLMGIRFLHALTCRDLCAWLGCVGSQHAVHSDGD